MHTRIEQDVWRNRLCQSLKSRHPFLALQIGREREACQLLVLNRLWRKLRTQSTAPRLKRAQDDMGKKNRSRVALHNGTPNLSTIRRKITMLSSTNKRRLAISKSMALSHDAARTERQRLQATMVCLSSNYPLGTRRHLESDANNCLLDSRDSPTIEHMLHQKAKARRHKRLNSISSSEDDSTKQRKKQKKGVVATAYAGDEPRAINQFKPFRRAVASRISQNLQLSLPDVAILHLEQKGAQQYHPALSRVARTSFDQPFTAQNDCQLIFDSRLSSSQNVHCRVQNQRLLLGAMQNANHLSQHHLASARHVVALEDVNYQETRSVAAGTLSSQSAYIHRRAHLSIARHSTYHIPPNQSLRKKFQPRYALAGPNKSKVCTPEPKNPWCQPSYTPRKITNTIHP